MERCFIIEPEASIHKAYTDYVILRDKNNIFISAFVKANITDRTDFAYIAHSGSFAITLTDEEYERFKPQLKKDYTYTEVGKLYHFKKNSPIGKAYKQLGITPADKPMLGFEFDVCLFSMRSRLFDYKDVLYASIDSDQMTKTVPVPPGWREINKSEFYAVIEEAERGEDNEHD